MGSKLRGLDATILEISDLAEDSEWDAFLQRVPQGHHRQTTLWARLKATQGWNSLRVIARRDGEIVGGAQLSHRKLTRWWGSVGQLPSGPVTKSNDADLRRHILEAVVAVARRKRIQFLCVQPPMKSDLASNPIDFPGFQKASVDLLPPATLLIDLDKSLEELSRGLRKSTRRNIRLAERRGVVVRECGRQELQLFHRLLQQTGNRQGFVPEPLNFYESLWDLFAPPGFLHATIAEVRGQPVASNLAIAFGSSVSWKRGGWSGEHGDLHPNEAILWESLVWGKSRGYKVCDVEGVDIGVARMLASGQEVAVGAKIGPSIFKIGFGGALVFAPPATVFIPNPIFRLGYKSIQSKLRNHRAFHWILNQFSGRRTLVRTSAILSQLCTLS